MNLAYNLETSALFFPDRSAIREGNKHATYRQLNELSNRIATSLINLGIKPGDHIALVYPNSLEWIAFYFGVLKTGAIAVTLPAALYGDELKNLISHSKPRIVFLHTDKDKDLRILKETCRVERVVCPDGDMTFDELIKQGSPDFTAINRNRTDTAVIPYTGGTTGIPKGVMLTHENILFACQAVVRSEKSTPEDMALCFLPFNHVFGQIHIMNSTIFTAGCIEILPAFNLDSVLNLFRSGMVTKFFSVPTVYVRLLSVPDLRKQLGKLRYCFSAGASMAQEIVKQWKETTGITISESYGMTEGLPFTFNHYYPERHVVGSVGQPVCMVEIQIRDTEGNILDQGKEGEICVRGRNVMKGYLDNPDATVAAFWDGEWLRTGDVGIIDAKGYIYIVDRIKDLIITGGENVSPREIEEILYTRIEVEECSVIGLPDREWGEKVAAFIVKRQGQVFNPDEIKIFLKTKLSPFKIPKEYHVIDALPKSAAGKILKRQIKQDYLKKINCK